VSRSRLQQIDMLNTQLENANNVTWQQWNLLDAARAHLSEVSAAKDALEAAHVQQQMQFATSPARISKRAAWCEDDGTLIGCRGKGSCCSRWK